MSLISPLASGVDSMVDALAPSGFADVIRDAKPYVVIEENHASRRVVALTLSSSQEVKATASAVTIHLVKANVGIQPFTAPDAVGQTGIDFGDRSEQGLAPGGQKLFGLGFTIPEKRPKCGPQPGAPDWDEDRIWNWRIGATRDFVSQIKGPASDTTPLRITLDAVIFDDGSLIGADNGNVLKNAMEGQIRARQDLYRQIVGQLARGASVEEAFQSIGPFPEPEGYIEHAGDPAALIARSEAMFTAGSLRKAYGDERIRETLERAILTRSFIVHRRSAH